MVTGLCLCYLEAVVGLSDLHTGVLGFGAVLVVQAHVQAPAAEFKDVKLEDHNFFTSDQEYQ